MKFKYHCNNTLPRMSWGAIITKNKLDIDVYHGNWVEANLNFFVEGAWDGIFDKGEFEKSSLFMGSGGKIEGSSVSFATPNHTLERLHVLRKDDKLFISNSLVFVLTMAEEKLDINYLYYISDFASISKGIQNYKDYIPLYGDGKVELYYYCNLLIDKELNIKRMKKTEPAIFNNYKEYHDFLRNGLKNITCNANSKNRNINYKLISTISTGYDSTACAALGSEIGCESVVTFNHPKKYSEDSGEEIAKILGYKNITEKSADKYLQNNDLIEAEFLSTGELGSSIVFSSFEEDVQKKLVLTGVFGDKVWDKNNKKVSSEILRSLPTSLYEFRLRVGFINIPLPFFGCIHHKYIHSISNSTEMKKWSTGNDYDRPIPRRIIEEKGVKRELFGFNKNGAGFNYRNDNLKRLRKRMSKKSFNLFKKFYSMKKSYKRLLKNIKYILFYSILFMVSFITFILNKLNIKVKINLTNRSNRYNCSPFSPSFLLHWGVSITEERYKNYNINCKTNEGIKIIKPQKNI